MARRDTNVLVRYLAQDDPAQSARATRLIERELGERDPGYISLVVLVEVCWVLKRLYSATVAELHETVRDLLGARQLVVEQRATVSARWQAWATDRETSRMRSLANALARPGASGLSRSTRRRSGWAWSCFDKLRSAARFRLPFTPPSHNPAVASNPLRMTP